ncbi:MAG: YdbH domain-containing protein [Desulfocapsa sp.]|nr:YdbH domain-containing protein [Desulfocapsa sp.]
MRIWKIVAISLVLSCVALAAVRFVYFDQTTNFLLQKLGAYGTNIRGLDIGFNRVKIDALTMDLELASGDIIKAELKNVSFRYDMQQLVTTGKGDQLDIDKMDITFSQLGKTSGKPMHFPEEIVLLKESLRRRIPPEQINIAQLQLHGDFPPQLIGKNIQLKASIKDIVLNVNAAMQVSPDTEIFVKLQSSNPFHADVTVIARKDNADAVKVSVALTPEILSGKGELDLEILDELLPSISGLLTTTLAIPLAGDSVKTISVIAAVEDFSWPGFSASFLQIQSKGTLLEKGYRLEKGSQFLAEQVGFGKTEISRIALDITGSIKQKEDRVEISFSDLQELEIQGLMSGDLKVADFVVQMEEALQVVLNTDKNTWTVSDNALHIHSLQIEKGINTFESSELVCRFSGLTKTTSKKEIHLEFETPTVLVGNEKQSLPLKEVSGSVVVKKNDINGKMQFAPQGVDGRGGLSFEHNIEAITGKFKLNTVESFELSPEGSLSSILSPWPYPFDLESGSVLFEADGAWNGSEPPRLSASMSLRGGGGYFKHFLFDDLDVQQDLAILPELYSKTEGSFLLQHLTGGIDVYDAKGAISVNPSKKGHLPLLELNDFRASLLDGAIRIANINYDLNQPESQFVVDVDAMSLSSLVELIKMEALHVTGRISGSIPVSIEGKNVTVMDGGLVSENPGGEIRYLPGTTEQSGVTGYALKAVENLQYKTLSVKAEYTPSGNLNLDIGLRGTSPELHPTRPVHLNIHAEQNLPELLQSLRFSKGLTEELDKRVKQHYN